MSILFGIFYLVVVNEVDYTMVINILEEFLGDSHLHNEAKGQISFDCPVCSHEIKGLDRGDGKGNLEVNYKLNVYKCWSCSDTHNTHGTIYSLIKKYGNQKLLKKYLLFKPDGYTQQNKQYKNIKLPKEFIPLKNIHNAFKLTVHYKQAISYLKKRNITEEQISKYNIGYCYQGDYANRIIIPSYDEDEEVNYFIARSFIPNTRLKYKNPDYPKELVIFNENLIDWSKPVYLVEGVFDSIFVDNSIPLLGKFISDNLFQKLYLNATSIIILLDGDAWTAAENLYHKLNCGKLMNKVWIIKLPIDKDIADLQGILINFEPKKID